MEADVVVMGAGFGGLSVGVRASELGLKTIVLEKGADADYPCNSRYSGGHMQVFQNNMTEDPLKLMESLTGNTAGFVPAELGKPFIDDARRALGWLRSHGALFIQTGPETHRRWVMTPPRSGQPGLDWKGRGPDAILRRLTSLLAANQGQLLLNARVTDVLIENGEVAGVEALLNGTKTSVRARAVVIADGGFQSDTNAIRKYITKAPDRIFQRNARGSTGDGMRLAEKIGARLTGLEWFYGHPLSRDAFHNDKLWPHPYLDSMCCSGIVVGSAGERFVDEGMGPWFLANTLARRDDPLDAVAIFDEAIWTGPAASLRSPPAPNPTFRDAGGTLHVASSIADLARAAGLPGDALAQSVAEYNKALADRSLGKLTPSRTETRSKAYAILKPPFYAAPICTGITYTMGGPQIDENCRVIHRDGHAIPNLFAVGSAAGGLEGGATVGYFGGLAKAFTTGLRAAEYIAGGNAASRRPASASVAHS